jgi:transcription elongation GreA/GreB family factor
MSKAFTKENDDAGVELTPASSLAVPSGAFRITTRGAELLAAFPEKRELLLRAEVLPPPGAKPERAVLGVTVRARTESGDERSYRLVTSEEQALTGEGCSVQSPIGRALLGRQVGDVCEVRTPKGSEEVEIIGLEGDC